MDMQDEEDEFFIPSTIRISAAPISAPIFPISASTPSLMAAPSSGKRKVDNSEAEIDASSMQATSKPRIDNLELAKVGYPAQVASALSPTVPLRQNHVVALAKVQRRASTESASVARKGRPPKKAVVASVEISISPSASSADGKSPFGNATGSGFSSGTSSLEGIDPTAASIRICSHHDFETIKKQIMSQSKNISPSLARLESPLRFTSEMQNELLDLAMNHMKDSAMTSLLNFGIRFNDFNESIKESFKNWINDTKKKSYTFRSVFLDCDPIGLMRLYIFTHDQYPHSGILANFGLLLKSIDGSVDPEAIQLAAQEAAELQSLPFFRALFDSDLMLRMIGPAKLLKLFSRKRDFEYFQYEALLLDVTKDRKLTPPFTRSLVVSAADAKCLEFFQAASDHLITIFDWDHIINAVGAALFHKNYKIIEIILSKRGYKSPQNRFRMLFENFFCELIANNANEYIFEVLLNTVIYDGTTMLISDASLINIYLLAATHGNIEIIDYLLRMKYFDLNDRFDQRSIFRIALENCHFNLAIHLIRIHNYSIFDSDTPHYNPPALGGDSLIYVARSDSTCKMFRLLLRLGANPNAMVATDSSPNSTPEKLIYYCIKSGFLILTRLLLKYKCTYNVEKAISYNISPKSAEMAVILFKEYKQNQIQ